MAGNTASTATTGNLTSTSNSMMSVSTNSAVRSSNANASSVRSNSALKEAESSALKREDDRNAAQNQAGAPPVETADSDAASRLEENEKTTAAQTPPDKKTTVAQDAPDARELALSARKASPTVENGAEAPKAKSQKSRSSAAATRQINGKIFTRNSGVWYDASYNGQATTNVSRNSGDYQKLDAGLRSVAGNLSGTVVIVWKNKAYRIQ
jgi:hypothetical protein